MKPVIPTEEHGSRRTALPISASDLRNDPFRVASSALLDLEIAASTRPPSLVEHRRILAPRLGGWSEPRLRIALLGAKCGPALTGRRGGIPDGVSSVSV